VLRISVVVPFRNEERHIGRCLAALENQEPFAGDHETVVVADRSTDGSAAIIRRFPRVRLIEAPTSGPYGARNAGVRETEGDLIAFTDADCERPTGCAESPKVSTAGTSRSRSVRGYRAQTGFCSRSSPPTRRRKTSTCSIAATATCTTPRPTTWPSGDARSRSSAASRSGGVEETRSSFGGSWKRGRFAGGGLLRLADGGAPPRGGGGAVRDYYGTCLAYGKSMRRLGGPDVSWRSWND
jgi:glycosyl transferase family 2